MKKKPATVPPLVIRVEADGHQPIVVTLRGRSAAGVRAVGRARGIPDGEAAALLLRHGLDIVTRGRQLARDRAT